MRNFGRKEKNFGALSMSSTPGSAPRVPEARTIHRARTFFYAWGHWIILRDGDTRRQFFVVVVGLSIDVQTSADAYRLCATKFFSPTSAVDVAFCWLKKWCSKNSHS